MARLGKAVNPSKATDVAVTLVNVILEPAVRKSWVEAGRSAIETGRTALETSRLTLTAVRETRDAWKRHR